jgi:hypothetical protein
MELQTWAIHGLDVWGNSKDGFDVNDVYPARETIEIPSDATDKQIAGLLGKHFGSRMRLEIDSHETDIYVSRAWNGRPLVNLRLKDPEIR